MRHGLIWRLLPVLLYAVPFAIVFGLGAARHTGATLLILAGGIVLWLAIFGPIGLLLMLTKYLTRATRRTVSKPNWSASAWSPSLGLGLNGFRARSGEVVGGGSYREVPLAPDERVVSAELGGYGTGPHNPGSGYITLSDRRIVFTGYKRPWLYKEYFALGSVSITYDDLTSWRFERRHGYMLTSFFKEALVLTTKDGKEHTFWPSFISAQDLWQRIDAQKRTHQTTTSNPASNEAVPS